jgi:hypothetical protein
MRRLVKCGKGPVDYCIDAGLVAISMGNEAKTKGRLYKCEPVTTSTGTAYRLQLIEDGEEVAQGLVSPLEAEEFGTRWIEDRNLAPYASFNLTPVGISRYPNHPSVSRGLKQYKVARRLKAGHHRQRQK